MLAYIQLRARNRYRTGERPIGREVGEKVRRLIDDHVISLGIDPKIPPISLTDGDFDAHVDKQRSPRAKASEMEHALRYHIRKHFDEDPEYYERLSERLKGILKELEGQWVALVEALKPEIQAAKKGRQADGTGLDPETQSPFFDMLQREVTGGVPADGALRDLLCRVTVDMVDHVQQELRLLNFWESDHAREVLRKWIVQFLDSHDGLLPFDRLEAVADRLVELAKANHFKLVRG